MIWVGDGLRKINYYLKLRMYSLATNKIAVVALILFLLGGCSSISTVDTGASGERKLYRRFPCEVDGEYRIIKLFYATDRQAKVDEGELYFTSQIGSDLTTGTLKARIDSNLEIGRMIPKRVKRKGAIGVREVERLNDEAFKASLIKAVNDSPNKSLLVIVFGYKDDFEMTATKAAYFAYLLDADTPVLLFDWPGDHWGAYRGYRKAEHIAAASGQFLGELLARITREVKPEKLWVESSSLGCQVVCKAFEWMHQYDDLADTQTEISHVIMAAPDVSQKEFDRDFKEEIASISNKLTVYVSSNDKALLMAEIIDWEKKLGFQRVKLEQNEQFEEARDMLYLKSLAPDNIEIVDVTLVNQAGGGHGYYIETPEFYDDFYMRLFDNSDGKNRRLYLMKVKDDVDYWIMRREK